jgi:hypothetical protein
MFRLNTNNSKINALECLISILQEEIKHAKETNDSLLNYLIFCLNEVKKINNDLIKNINNSFENEAKITNNLIITSKNIANIQEDLKALELVTKIIPSFFTDYRNLDFNLIKDFCIQNALFFPELMCPCFESFKEIESLER